MKKILFYYWDPIDGPAGGGVTAYLKELFPVLLKTGLFELYYLNSGRKYDDSGKAYIQERQNIFEDRVRSFEVVNCPILAPSKQSVRNVRQYLECTDINLLLTDLIDRIGGTDIIHFHSLEGLPVRLLELKEKYPEIKFIYSFHNYFPLCTQVNMWKNDEACCNMKDLSRCEGCYERENYDDAIYRFMHLDIPDLKKKNLLAAKKSPDQDEIKLYGRFYEANKDCFNKYMDIMLAVSDRTRKVLISHGYDPNKIFISYVGTEIAKMAASDRLKKPGDGFRIVFMGYPRRDKGFYFFLDSLEEMPEDMAHRLEVTVLAKGIEEDCKKRLKNLQNSFRSVSIINGYKDYDELSEILSRQDLGVVPVLWEDNLPRVAIEQVSLGVPIITSNLGGASELFGGNEDYIFEAGNVGSFIGCLQKIINNPGLLDSFWDSVKKPVTMDEHVTDLMQYYLGE